MSMSFMMLGVVYVVTAARTKHGKNSGSPFAGWGMSWFRSENLQHRQRPGLSTWHALVIVMCVVWLLTAFSTLQQTYIQLLSQPDTCN